MTSDIPLTPMSDTSAALTLPLGDFVQVLVNGNEIHLTTFVDEGRGPFRYEIASLEALKTAVKALPLEGPLGQLTLIECLDSDHHGLHELYNWLANYSEQKGFALTLTPCNRTTAGAVAWVQKYATKHAGRQKDSRPKGVELEFEMDSENILLLNEADLPVERQLLRALGLSRRGLRRLFEAGKMLLAESNPEDHMRAYVARDASGNWQVELLPP